MAPRYAQISLLAFILIVLASFLVPHVQDAAPITSVKKRDSTWNYKGCYTDSVGTRTLSTNVAVAGGPSAMSHESCQAACMAQNFLLSGTEYSAECWCGNDYLNGGAPASDGETGCSMACNGDATESCGGPNRLTVFSYDVVVPAAPSWYSLGCYTDSTGARTLLHNTPVVGSGAAMSHETCQAACSSAGYIFSGTEYSGECWCDSTLNNGGALALDLDGNAGCSMACNGNTTEFCGGPNRLTLYAYGVPGTNGLPSTTNSSVSVAAASSTSAVSAPSGTAPAGWSSLGCYVDSTGARTLSTNTGVAGGPTAMSHETCIAACQAGGFAYSGTEYSGECWCGNALLNGAGPAPDGNAKCTMTCNGDTAEICGGPNRLTLFVQGTGPPSVTTTSSTGAAPSSTAGITSNAASTATTSLATVATGLPDGWSYAGCYVDTLGGRIMTGKQPDDQATTVENCVSKCVALGLNVSGIEYGVQCFCDNFLRNDAALATADTECSMSCPGNTTEKCGAGNRVSVYNTGTLATYHTPVPKQTGIPGNWVYQGCLEDGPVPRPLTRFVNLGQLNSPTACFGQCALFGYNAAGMEYGTECYCGDVADVAYSNYTLQPATDCSFSCPGDPEAICGAGNRLTYYTWTTNPVTQFAFPRGAAAGAYQFLIGGVIVPLMTQLAVNGKVVFLEKWGTGPPNTTGTYELDLASLNNFTEAWRPLHVQTDIFCSAGLTLPDKVGRQINIGGWSGESTYGIRLYWPDGSPGVWGTHDWQEDYTQVALQNGRWYPSAMIMANGTILVVGGEDGSNGAPVPTLELLPKFGGVLTMDWLQRTDPYNLYPFLAVLPSGGIFVAYYNEARVLDEVDFSTTKTLPNMPGSVGNPAGGRTYPLEGTMVLLPQYAPYTAPLGILICGGSEPFIGGDTLVIDNCISTTPESTNPVWTIERMPSPRVMSCMTALPDGTYLILNGAYHGVAGFGLASDPNHNAVLYDPTKPIGSRMSIMANTTVDRFYHSEAILLQDGRVMVSGSDPETDGLLQEYRVEVFIPPYLLSGAPKPTFTITNQDWSYDQSVTLTITSSTGARNLKISLLGAESSTHGNSMGQRTIFPAFSCSGNTCTVQAPPNSHVCPPGWFQLFVLDGGVPSLSVFVRIGGDPGSLGNWPAGLSSFTVPGI